MIRKSQIIHQFIRLPLRPRQSAFQWESLQQYHPRLLRNGFYSGLKQWIWSSSSPSSAVVNAQDLNDFRMVSHEISFHALSIHFTIIRHNEVRDLTAVLLAEVCTNTTIEPTLAPLTGEKRDCLSSIKADDARADVSARGLWQKGQTTYFDVRVFNPVARCCLNRSLIAVHRANENEKKSKLQSENHKYRPRNIHTISIFLFWRYNSRM